MSAKQAKRLRQVARGLAVVLEEQGKTIHARGLFAKEHKKMGNPSSIVGADGSTEEAPQQRISVTAYNRPDSLRAIVRNFKRGLKSGEMKKDAFHPKHDHSLSPAK